MCRHTLPEWHAAIGSHKRNFVAKKGEVIIKEGEPVTGVYFVTSGYVKVHKHWGDKELIIRFANDGALLIPYTLVALDPQIPASDPVVNELE